jgi:hypothetical protein
MDNVYLVLAKSGDYDYGYTFSADSSCLLRYYTA